MDTNNISTEETKEVLHELSEEDLLQALVDVVKRRQICYYSNKIG